MTPELNVILGRLAVALALGLLIGLERGWERRDAPEGARTAGFRTFGLIGLLGGIAGAGELTVAAASAVVVTILLGFKPELHELLRRIDRTELEATLRLLLISVVVLPILPNRTFGPWQALNPYRIWWMVVLVAGISYLGYLANRLIGLRAGVIATALFGGMTSSTAVTVTLSRKEHENPAARNLFVAGIIAASGIMFPRMLAIVAIVASDLAIPLAPPLIIAALVAFCLGALIWGIDRHRAPRREMQSEFRNPLDLRTALEFGVFFAIIMLLSQAARQMAGAAGLYIIGAIDGLVDVDAITLSVATLWTRGDVVPRVAVITLGIAAAVNTIVKIGIAGVIGGPRLGLWVGVPMLAALVAGALTIVWPIL